jgi:hypothetical protein
MRRFPAEMLPQNVVRPGIRRLQAPERALDEIQRPESIECLRRRCGIQIVHWHFSMTTTPVLEDTNRDGAQQRAKASATRISLGEHAPAEHAHEHVLTEILDLCSIDPAAADEGQNWRPVLFGNLGERNLIAGSGSPDDVPDGCLEHSCECTRLWALGQAGSEDPRPAEKDNPAFSSWAVGYEFTAANGDTLRAGFTGQASLTAPGVLTSVDTATISGGTGRFASASGNFTAERVVRHGHRRDHGFLRGNDLLARCRQALKLDHYWQQHSVSPRPNPGAASREAILRVKIVVSHGRRT